jgi:general secretion pathway protein D
MNRLKRTTAILLLPLLASACVSYSAYQKAKDAEKDKNWDVAVMQYEKALEIAPDNTQYKLALDRAKRSAAREHFQKGRAMLAAAATATGPEQYRLAGMASTELQITVKLDPTNQYAAVELSKALQLLETIRRAASEQTTIDDIKKRAKASVTKAQPPQLNPASTEPITLTFPRETNVKDIYRALGNAYGINILYDQAVKDDRITIELHDVTAQAALERVMQAANHFYKVLDEKTIIVVPDNPQARRDYEDLVIRTFYLSNGDAEQVTNVVRTMIEARNVFPLKALNAITIRDTADKVRIAEKIIEANDKAKAEVVVTVELVQLDLNRVRDIGFAVGGFPTASGVAGATTVPVLGSAVDDKGNRLQVTGGTIDQLRDALTGGFRNTLSFTLPQATYGLLKTLGNSELLANPELRISEGEKATLHIGQRIPVPVSTFTSAVTGTQGGTFAPVTSYQYQDVGIKVAMEPRVHHNQEVTLKLTVEVSNLGARIEGQPSFATRTIESTIRLKDGETNFLAGLIQSTLEEGETKTPFLGDLPFIGRLFTNSHRSEIRTDLVLTMTPHIIRMPNITEDDLAPMWVGTTNNLTFRGVSPRIESQAGIDPFNAPAANPRNLQQSADGEPGNFIVPEGTPAQPVAPPVGAGPTDPFRRPQPQPQPTTPPATTPANPPQGQQNTTTPPASIWRQNPPGTSSSLDNGSSSAMKVAAASADAQADIAALRLAPRIAPQPASMKLGPGESKLWNLVGMDLDGLTTTEIVLQFDARHMDVTDVSFGPALAVNPQLPPVVTINRDMGTIRITSTDGKPLAFVSGGEVLSLRVHGGLSGDTFLIVANPQLRDARGMLVQAAISGGRAHID